MAFSRNRGCGLPTARCYNQLRHMSWCQYWIEEIDSPCGARCRNEKGYCELHTKLRPVDFGIARHKNNKTSDRAEETNTTFAQRGDIEELAGSLNRLKQVARGEQSMEEKDAVQEEGEHGRNEKTNEKELEDRSVPETGSSLNVENIAAARAEKADGQESPELDAQPPANVAIDESRPAFRKKRERNENPTKAINKAKKQAEKKVAQEEQFKKSHGKSFKRKKGHT